MSSAIFYRFRSQKNASRIFFDGTGITVFDLKKEIINENKLGDGTGFELRLYHNDTEEEYADDTVVIPRSTSVVARRSPPSKGGRSNAARYVTGKPRITKITLDLKSKDDGSFATEENKEVQADTKMSEEDRINAMFANQDDQWSKVQQNMSAATPVFNKPTGGATAGATNDVPPPGYMCYRCGSKDHWIKNCPTNNDPNWEGKRIKRTTGIPKTYLQTIENPEDDPGKSYMMNAEGQFVRQRADERAWSVITKKLNKTKEVIDDLKDVEPELLDPITGKVMEDPVTTPCCQKAYGRTGLEDRLLEQDFVCPNCGKEDIFLDTLKPDEELKAKIDTLLDSEFTKRGIKRERDDEADEEDQDTKKQKLDNAKIPFPVMPMMPFGFMPPFGMMPPVLPPAPATQALDKNPNE